MAKFIFKSINNTTMEVIPIKESKQIMSIRLSDNDSEIIHNLTENQVSDLKRQINNYYDKYQADKPLVVKVTFNGVNGSTNRKCYNFFTRIKTLKKGERVIVDSLGQEMEAEVVSYVNNPMNLPSKWVIRKHKPTYLTDDYVFIIPPKDDELNENRNTNRIKISPSQSKESLIKYGFTNHVKDKLYYCKIVGNTVSLNITVDIDTLKITGVDVLDENFGQPFDYQSMILKGKATDGAIKVYHNVNDTLSKLQHDGIIIGFEKGMYI